MTTVRKAIADVAAAVEADRPPPSPVEAARRRPALKARQGAEGRDPVDFYMGMFSGPLGRPTATTAGASPRRRSSPRSSRPPLLGRRRRREPLSGLMDDAVTLIEPLIAAL